MEMCSFWGHPKHSESQTCEGETSQLRASVRNSSQNTNGASDDGGRVIVLPSAIQRRTEYQLRGILHPVP